MTRQRKKLVDLTIKHNFMFCAVMMDPEICRQMLERVLGMEIARVEVDRERCFIYHPEYKGVVLDIYAKDELNTHYDVEMQMVSRPALPRRARYYHSQMDMELLEAGCDYQELPNTYVIFICDFDPFEEKKYRYLCGTYCKETGKLVDDGQRTIFLNTVGEDPNEVPEDLVKFLKYVHAGLEESQKDWEDTYIEALQERVAEIKASREMGDAYMRYSAVLKDEYREGVEVGRLDTLREVILRYLLAKGEIPQKVKIMIENETNLQILDQWVSYAFSSNNVEAFIKQIEENRKQK